MLLYYRTRLQSNPKGLTRKNDNYYPISHLCAWCAVGDYWLITIGDSRELQMNEMCCTTRGEWGRRTSGGRELRYPFIYWAPTARRRSCVQEKTNERNVLPAPRQRKKGQVLTGWNCELGTEKKMGRVEDGRDGRVASWPWCSRPSRRIGTPCQMNQFLHTHTPHTGKHTGLVRFWPTSMERAAANVRRNQLLKLLCTTPKNVLAIQWENGSAARKKTKNKTTTRTSGQLRPKQKEEKQWRKAGT